MINDNPWGENLSRFVDAITDDQRLALGLEALRAARQDAWDRGFTGWAEAVTEYVVALEDGKGLNRPL